MSQVDIQSLRQEYMFTGLRRSDLNPNPFEQFQRWFQQACESQIAMPNAMLLATVDSSRNPSARIVLLNEISDEKFIFFTNYGSSKAQHIAKHSTVCLHFFWAALERQIKITGIASLTSIEQSKKYFASRPRGSQISAWSSKQSSPVKSRADLERDFEALSKKFENQEVPLPEHWGGYAVTASSFEFWQGRESRLHDRFQYLLDSQNQWSIQRLSP